MHPKKPRHLSTRPRTDNNHDSINHDSASRNEMISEATMPQGGDTNLEELKKRKPAEIIEIANELGLTEVALSGKLQEMIFAILKYKAAAGETIYGSGTLEIMNEGNFGFLRSTFLNYNAGIADTYVSSNFIRKLGLRTGDVVTCTIRPPKEHANERYFAMQQAISINGQDPRQRNKIIPFENLTPLFADEQIVLETGSGHKDDITGRIVDMIAPIGKGQRGLIVSPPKAGKTVILQNVAHAIAQNYPEISLFVLLIDERPEEVTDMQRSVRGTVIASTFDEPAHRQVQVAEMVIEQAKREVECGKDVVILLDSITRLARAYNNITPASGKILSGGVDANALQRPKRFFGAARNIEEGGSLTIIATALIDTGSKMDEVIYEEFKGTGNMELHLYRECAEKRIFPAIDINRSGTRKENLLIAENLLAKIIAFRTFVHQMNTVDSIQFLIEKLRKTKTNVDFVESMTK